MLWAVPGHCQEDHNLSKSKIKAENKPSVSMDDHVSQCLKPCLALLQLADADITTLCACYQHSTLLLGKASQKRQGHSKHTYPSTAAPLLLAGSRKGTGTWFCPQLFTHWSGAAAMKSVELLEYNMGVNSYPVYVDCLPPSVPSCAHTSRRVWRNRIWLQAPQRFQHCSWFLFLRNVIIKSRCKGGREINAPWV